MNEKTYKKISAYETISNPDPVDVIPTVHTQPDGRKINRNIPFSTLKGDTGGTGPVGPQGPEGPAGPKGDKGDTGSQGIQGDKGDTGSAATVAVGSTTTGNAGTNAVVTNSGSSSAAVLNFTIPRGPQGPKGDKGDKGDAGDQGPTGPQGIQGPKGDQGIQGETGAGVNIIGTLNDPSELPASGNAGDAYLIDGDLYVWTGTSWENVGSIEGPQGPQGPQGEQGVQGPKGDKGDTGAGVAAGGSTGQILSKNSATNYDTAWVDPPTSGVWGQITGSLSSQTDLSNALDAKVDDTSLTNALPSTVGTNGQVLKSNGTSVTWQADANTTYSEISEAEIDAGTASTGRTISGRRVSYIKSLIMGLVYPVGSLYFNATDGTNPASLLGVGTWEAYAQGRVPVGKAGSGTFRTAGDTMGAETHTLTVAQMPSHNHSRGDSIMFRPSSGGTVGWSSGSTMVSGSPVSEGGGGAHNNVQPSIVVHIWRRTS